MLCHRSSKPSVGKKRQSKPFSKSRWNVFNFFAQFDLFAKPIPAFNVRGKDQVKTPIGGILSTIIITLTLGFAIIKWNELVARSDPIVNRNEVTNHYNFESEGIYLQDTN